MNCDDSTSWHLLQITVDAIESELVSDFLWSQGVVAIEEAVDGELVILTTSFGEDIDRLKHRLLEQFPDARTDESVVARSVADTWREHVDEIVIDETLCLVPSWLDAQSESAMNDNAARKRVFIDPEDSFGLGNHPTTIGALRIVRSMTPDYASVFDFGAGSGVLGISMAVTHSCSVFACDIADNAQYIIERNAKRNGVDVAWVEDPEALRSTFDVVIANILAPVLRQISSNIRQMTVSGSVIVLAGMRTEQWQEVRCHYDFCDVVLDTNIDGWISVGLRVR